MQPAAHTPIGPSRQTSGDTIHDGVSGSDRARNRLSRADIFGNFIQNSTTLSSGSRAGRVARDQSGQLADSYVIADAAANAPFQRKETKQERDARKRERYAAQRLLEREESLRTEGVDGGYLVTLGTYTGPEDFGKAIVRQLQVSVLRNAGGCGL